MEVWYIALASLQTMHPTSLAIDLLHPRELMQLAMRAMIRWFTLGSYI
jgi:hypothetical protein